MTLTIRIRGDRQTVQGNNAYELVGAMNRSSLDGRRDQREWMREAATRANALTGLDIRADTASHFIDDLMSAGLISTVTEGTDHD